MFATMIKRIFNRMNGLLCISITDVHMKKKMFVGLGN